MPRLTTLFADISDSTALFERYGNQQTRKVMAKLLAGLGQVAQSHQGKLVKTIGDEALCLFPAAAHAIEAAIAMQKAVAGRFFVGSDALAIRIGLFHGEVVIEPDDIFGDGVNVAARLVALANAGQILTDRSSLDEAMTSTTPLPVSWRELGPIAVKGKSEPLNVVDLLWQEDDTNLTSVARVLDTAALATGQLLHLRLGTREWPFKPADAPVHIGRDPGCQLAMTSATVSRHHAVIEYRSGQFVFTDKSSNGSWLRLGGELLRVHRGSVPLFGQGEIHCGSVYDSSQKQTSQHIIHFLTGS